MNHRLALPCGCYAWRFGGQTGAVPCNYHAAVHHVWDDPGPHEERACDCIMCRAAKRGVGPWEFAREIHDRAAAEVRAAVGGKDVTEEVEYLGCGCLLARAAARWEVQIPCAEHDSPAARARVAEERARRSG